MFKKISIHYVIFILAIGALTIVMLFLRSGQQDSFRTKAVLKSGSLEVPVALADTAALRQQGLSDTASLPAGAGMLFVFSAPAVQGFWMKDMQYPLDIVWIDNTMTVVGIAANVMPDTYPQVFYSPAPVQYVLEVNAGYAQLHGIAVGKQFTL